MTPDTATTTDDVAVVKLDAAVASARRAMEIAEAVTPVRDELRSVAGEAVRFRVAGDALADQLLAALEHHPPLPPGTDAALTVHAWDTAASGAPVPALSDGGRDAPAWSVVAGERAASSSRGWRAFEAVDRTAAQGWLAVHDPALLSHGERGAPFRLVFHWWNAPRGRVLAHAAVVGIDGIGVLLAGPGGSGKSSVALACVEAGFQYVGDDYCLVAAAPVPTACSLYATGKVAPADRARYPGLVDAASPFRGPHDDKILLLVSRARPDRIVEHLTLCALVVPRVSGDRRATARRVSRGRALRALAPSTLAQLPGGAAETMPVLADLARMLPCYELELGSDRDEVPGVVRRLIDDAVTA